LNDIHKNVEEAINLVNKDPLLHQMQQDSDTAKFAQERAKEILHQHLHSERESALEKLFLDVHTLQQRLLDSEV